MELKAKIDARPLRIRVSERGQIETVRVALDLNRERAKAGLDAHGQPFPAGVTKSQIDMTDTGRLLSDVQVYTTRYQFMAPYARVVDDKWGFAGVYDDEGKAEIARRVEALLEGEVYAEEG